MTEQHRSIVEVDEVEANGAGEEREREHDEGREQGRLDASFTTSANARSSVGHDLLGLSSGDGSGYGSVPRAAL